MSKQTLAALASVVFVVAGTAVAVVRKVRTEHPPVAPRPPRIDPIG